MTEIIYIFKKRCLTFDGWLVEDILLFFVLFNFIVNLGLGTAG